MRHARFLFVFFVFFAFSVFPVYSSTAFAVEIKNVRPLQVGSRIMFEFDVVGDEPNEDAEVSITITVKDKQYTQDSLHVEGDYGKTKTGRGKKIYWNVLQDFPRGLNENFDWDISASGGKVIKDRITGMELVFVKGGCFQMGDVFGGRFPQEKPVHEVCLDDFYIGKYEVMQREWQVVMGNNPSYYKDCGDNCPVECVSWNDTQEFIRRLNERVPLSKGGTRGLYRLPKEAEWEYAARSGGKNEKWAGTSDQSEIDDYMWHEGNASGFLGIGKGPRPAGQKKPNGLGLYDMSGNVWEWCQDWYDDNYYKNSPRDNPAGPLIGSEYRVHRGGLWDYGAGSARTTARDRTKPNYRGSYSGFRIARTK